MATTIEEVSADLKAHAASSENRYDKLVTKIEDIKMAEPTHIKNIFEPGNPIASMLPLMGGSGGMAGAGAGLGAGLLGGVLGGVLLNRGGLLGGGVSMVGL